MMDDVIYGVMFKAKIDIWLSDPPVIASRKSDAPPVEENKLLNTSPLTPGR